MSDNKIKHCAECRKPMQYAPGIGYHCADHGDGPAMEDAAQGAPSPAPVGDTAPTVEADMWCPNCEYLMEPKPAPMSPSPVQAPVLRCHACHACQSELQVDDGWIVHRWFRAPSAGQSTGAERAAILSAMFGFEKRENEGPERFIQEIVEILRPGGSLRGTDFQIGYAGDGNLCFVANKILTDGERDAIMAVFDKYRIPVGTKLPGRIIPTPDGDLAFEGLRYRDHGPYYMHAPTIIFGQPWIPQKSESPTADLDLIDECLDLYSERIAHSGNAKEDEREGCCVGHSTLVDARKALARLYKAAEQQGEKP